MLTRRIVAAVVALVVVAVALVLWPREDTWELAADFSDTTGVYEGNEVQYLGVPVGKITSIEPRGTVMRVHMEISSDTKIPRDAVAEILQSALLTDRLVQVGPAYTGGETFPAGATIGVRRTRSPVSFDDLGASIDQLVVALDREGPDGRDIGDLLAVTADNLDGNGGRIRDLLAESRRALASVNAKEPDLQRVADNLRMITRVLTKHDATVRRFTGNLSSASQVVAGQTGSLDQTLRSLSVLSTEVTAFIEKNRGRMRANLREVSQVAATIHRQQDTLDRVFDYLPMGAENITRAYDPQARSIQVQIAARDSALFNQQVRNEFCQSLAGDLCAALTNAEGTGPLDVIMDAAEGLIPWWL